MGMSASQARLLSITARQSDLELKSQMISNAKLRLTQEGEVLALEYSDALNKTKLQATKIDLNQGIFAQVDMNAAYFLNENSIRVIDVISGKPVIFRTMSDEERKAQGITDERYRPNATAGEIAEMIASGAYMIQQGTIKNDYVYEDGKKPKESDYDWSFTSNATNLNYSEVADEDAIRKAEANYDFKIKELNNKEKKYDMQLKQIDTEHEALQTEYDSVQKVIQKNIETSFKIFA